MNDHDSAPNDDEDVDHDDERGFSHKAHSIQLAAMFRLLSNLLAAVVFVTLVALVAWILLTAE